MSGKESWSAPVARLRSCLNARERERTGFFTLEGLRLVERAFRADVDLRLVVVSRQLVADLRPRVQGLLEEVRAARGVELHVVPDEVVLQFVEGRGYGGILALAKIPGSPSLKACLEENPAAVLLVALDAQDPGNVGALVRTALASGASALIAIGLADPYHPKAVRTSMGSLFRLPLLRYENVAELQGELRELEVTTLGAVSQGGENLPEVQLDSKPSAIFLGSEAFGLPEELCQSLDRRITIPMAGLVDSFSINAAAAVLLYELLGRSS